MNSPAPLWCGASGAQRWCGASGAQRQAPFGARALDLQKKAPAQTAPELRDQLQQRRHFHVRFDDFDRNADALALLLDA